ncbi:MAG: hypothetical protein ABSF26_22285 [Thermoguttaceae bacterium]|jgi:hypothetical protein
MDAIDRRDFTGAALAALAGAMLGPSPAGASPSAAGLPLLPMVRWGKHNIVRVLVGHNPVKGTSHFSPELSREMREFFAADPGRGPQLLQRCEQLGINTCQMGSPMCEAILREHYAQGGKLQWIPTFYSQPGEGKAELARILKMDPRPIGAQHFGGTTDALFKQGKLDRALETLKMLRDAGLLVGLCSHNHEVIDYAEHKGWDVDFYQCCFYRVSSSLRPPADPPRPRPRGERGEIFEEEARRAMLKVIRQVAKPCIAFKVLAGNRHCGTPQAIQDALRFALEQIKPSDVILLGMWQKHKDQAAENVGYVRKILAAV